MNDHRDGGERRATLGRGWARAVCALPLFGVAVGSLPAAAQWQQNEYQQQKEAALQYEPSAIEIRRRAPPGAPKVVRLRFYADGEFRSAGGMRWQDRMRAQLGLVNEVLEPAFGVRLEAESFRRWERKGPAGALAPMLDELERLDRGAEVDWVIGLAAPLPLVSMSFHDLGMARLLGRHFVLRSIASIAEMDDFNRVFHALEPQQRDALYSRRKSHKEISVFLHEWAHTLGAIHVAAPTRIMGPACSQRSSLFSEEDAGLIAEGLHARLEARGKDVVEWSPLKRFVLEHGSPDWAPGERAALLSLFDQSTLRPAVPGATPVPAATPAGAAAADADFVTQAQTHLRAQRRNEALAVVRQAAASAEQRRETNPSTWITIARLYGQIGAVTEADQILAKAAGLGPEKAVTEAAAELLRWRRSIGLPRPSARFALAADAEPDYVAAVLRVRSLMSPAAAVKVDAAARASQEELRRFPGGPGLHALACEIAQQAGRNRDAARSCALALAAMEDFPRVHYVTGVMSANAGRLNDAIKSLRRAATLSPGDQAYERALGEVSRAAGRGREFEAWQAARAHLPPESEPTPAATPVPAPAPRAARPAAAEAVAEPKNAAPAGGPVRLPPSAFTPPPF